MLTTIHLKINKQILEFRLFQGDNLWKKVQQFCKENDLQKYDDQIFNLIYNEFVRTENFENRPQSSFKAIIPSTQLHNQQDQKVKILQQKQNRSISPSTKVLNPKQQPNQKSLKTKFVNQQINQVENKLFIQDYQIPQDQNVMHYQNEHFYFVEAFQQQHNTGKKILINNIAKLDNLIKLVYKQIENISIENSIYPICVQLYSRLLSTQENRKTLKLNMINYNLLEDKEIYVLEQIVQKYSLSLVIEMSKSQFLILMIGLIISDDDQKTTDGTKVKEFINFNPSLTPHYQLYC
ncbi:unnamed protein product [Paramecium sonneborni]|uniref:Uncharacterized protein n=1 Tax=Paramecium sonneborni TaxID=65129 RepID=A0A8S1LXV6_9CILI|nr:unnamed protein product [Paramecium sonneborni]